MDQLNTLLAENSYIGATTSATQADYAKCKEIGSQDLKAFPHVLRWHTHISFLVKTYGSSFDYQGRPVPGAGGAAAAAPAAPKAAAKKQASPKKEPAPAPKASPKKEAKAAPAAAAAAPAGGNAADIEAKITGVGDDIRKLKEKLKGEGLSGKKINDHEEVKKLVSQLQELKTQHAAAPAAPAAAAAPAAKAASPKAKPASPKQQAKKDKKGGGEPKKDDAKKDEDPEAARKALLKKVIKEGGKRGVEIEGAADMGGLQFFCTSVEFPDGDLELLTKSAEAMNEKSDPTEEERKGGSGAIGKMVFSAGTDQLGVLAYVPEEKLGGDLVTEEWIKAVLATFGGKVEKIGKTYCTGFVKADGDKGIFPLKIREPMILEANNYLRKRGLFPEDDGDSDEMVFGDDDFPSM